MEFREGIVMSPISGRNKKISMRSMLFILVFCVSIPSLSLLLWLRIQSENGAVDAIGRTAMEIARGVAVAEQVVSSTTRSLLERMSKEPAIHVLNIRETQELLINQIRFSDMYTDILLINSSGDILVSGAGTVSQNFFDMISQKIPLRTDLMILPGYLSPPHKRMIVPYVLGIMPDEKNIPHYAIVALVDVKVYTATIKSLNIPSTWSFSMVDANGTFLFRYPSQMPKGERGAGEKVFGPVWERIQAADSDSWFRGESIAGIPRIFGFVKLRTNPNQPPYITILTLYLEKQALQGMIHDITLSILLMFYLIGLCSILAIYLGMRYLTQPVEKFLEVTKRVAAGELAARSNVDYRLGEIGMLASAFDEMADILEAQNKQRQVIEAELALYTSGLEEMVELRTQELDESQKRTRLILDSTSEGILELDMENRVTFANKAVFSILDKKEKNLLSYHFFDVFSHSDQEGALYRERTSPLQKALDGTEETRVSGIVFLREDGTGVPVDIYVAPVVCDERRTGSVLTFVDLSESMETHELMSAIYNTTTNGYLLIAENAEIQDCNPAMVSMLGAQNKQEIIDDFARFSPLYQKDGKLSREQFLSNIPEVIKKGSLSIEWLHLDAEKNSVPCAVTLMAVKVNQRHFIVGHSVDLRSQIKAKEVLEQKQEQLQKILDSTPVALVIILGDVVQSINVNGTCLLGLNQGDAVSSDYFILEGSEDILKIVEQGGLINNQPARLESKTGHVHETLMTLIPFIYDGEKAVLVWIVDVTELASARQIAEKAAHAQSDFLARMSHEIRTPMNAILGMSHLCLQTNMSSKQHNYLSKIHGAATSLLSLINDILDISKINAGKLTLEKTLFSLSEMFKNLWDLLAFKAQEKGLLFSFDVDKSVPDCLIGDSLRLNQILLNLCNNAIKFTERGKIVLRVFAENLTEEREGQSMVRLNFSVSDTGIGMTSEQSERLFTPFTQAESSITRKYGGSGLGLAICKNLVESMEGNIRIESVFEEGTIVYFTVKMEAGEIGQNLFPPIFSIHGLRVLVVDDDDSAREILYEQLSSLGLRVETAASGCEALDKLRSALAEKDSYFFVLLDWRMPVMDGEEVVLRMRDVFDKGGDPHIIMISSYCEEECRDLSKKLNVAAFLPKPIRTSDLYDTLISILAAGSKDWGSESSFGCEETRIDQDFRVKNVVKGRVLLVEDNPINQEIALELLQQRGVRVDIANNGAEALAAVKNKKYDLVFMDIQMPVMDGFEATRSIRALPDCSDDRLPIVAMTAHAMQGDYEKSLSAGMNDHITKPINPEELYQTLDKWIKVGQNAGNVPKTTG